MENERQIEIKIDGNICTLNYVNESETSKSRVSGQMSLCGSLANFDDLTLTISKLDDFTPSHKNVIKINPNNINKNLDKKLENTNEKSKLEITYMSIFNSEQKNENSSIKKTPFNQIIINRINENDEENLKNENNLKDSVIKKLNFDLCDSSFSLEKSEKNFGQVNQNFKENISKNLNKRYFIHEKNLNNNKNIIEENNNNKSIDENKKYININKSPKTFKNRCHSFQRERRKIKRISLDSNDSIKKNNNKINLDNINNNISKNNSNSKISIQKLSHIKKNTINNNYSTVQEIMNSEKYKERKEKLHKYFDKLSESKNNARVNYVKLTSEKFKKDSKINGKLSKISEHLERTEEKIKNKNNEEILKTSKKLFPQLSSTNSFNISNSKNKLALGHLSSIKKNYYYQTPSSSNIKLGNITTSTKNGSLNSNMNTPIISNTLNSKLSSISKTDNKEIIMKLYYGNSTSKKLFKNNQFNDSTNKKLSNKKNDFLVDKEKDSIKYLLKKHNTDLKNVLKINNKKIQTILLGKNCIGKNLNVKNNLNNNRLNEINEFKQFIQKNQFDKELLKTIKKRGSFH